MTAAARSPLLQFLHGVADDGRNHLASDAMLLQRFQNARDESAFQTIVRRHGPMVLDVCRAIVGNDADAEDAFQATFLILAGKAASIRKTASLASWLHGVACRTAQRARAAQARRRRREIETPPRETTQPDELSWREARQVLHEELGCLAERHREPLVLCYLQGRTQDQAAALLGMSESTLKKRLERGRAVLRARLMRRGLGVSGGLIAAALPSATGLACPAALLASTAAAAVKVAAGGSSAGIASASVLKLQQACLRGMLAARLKAAAVVLALSVGAVAGAVGIGQQAGPGAPPRTSTETPAARPEVPHQPGVAAAAKIPGPATVVPSHKDWLVKAEASIGKIEDPQLGVTMLVSLAKCQADGGDRGAAARTFARAKSLCEKVMPPYQRGSLLGWVAEVQAETGDVSAAFDTAESISRIDDQQASELKQRAWWYIARAQAQRGEHRAALDNIDQIKGDNQEWLKDQAWRDVAVAQVQAGKSEEAVRTAARIRAPMERAQTWAHLAKALHARKDAAARKCLDNAIQALNALAGEEFQGVAEYYVLDAKASLGDRDEALRTAQESRNHMALSAVAVAQARAGAIDDALKTARLVAADMLRDYALRDIAALASFEQATKLVHEVKYDWVKATIWTKLGRRCADDGNRAKAREAFKQAIALCGQVTDPPHVVNARLGAVQELAEALARARFLDDAAALAQSQTEPAHRAGAMLSIAWGLRKE